MRARLRAFVETLAALAVVLALVLAAGTVWQPVRVSGLSMYPTLLPGDVVVVSRAREVVKGDVVLVQVLGHGPVLHRVVSVSSGGAYTTRGDANAVVDRESVPAHAVRGVVVRVVPVGTLLRRWRGVGQVGYHDGSTAYRQAMTETTFVPTLSGQRRARVC